MTKTPDQIAAGYREYLLNDLASFWFPRSVDLEHGGFFSSFDRDGTLVDTDKSVWAQGRMSWMALRLHQTMGARHEWLEWGQSGVSFLESHCIDADGRLFFHVTADGRGIRKRRYAFSESFAAIAHAALFSCTRLEINHRRAMELFRQFVRISFDPHPDPSTAKFTGVRPMIGMGPRMITIVTARELLDTLGEALSVEDRHELDGWIERCVVEIERWFVKPDLKCVMESVGPDGAVLDHFDGRILNPGHAIEGAWFILWEGHLRGRQDWVDLGLRMLDWMFERGWDDEFGGLLYFVDVYGKPIQEYWHEMKFWWPHCETLIATHLAWKITGSDRYADWFRKVHEWSFKRFADPEHGEWYGYLRRDGSVSSPLKGNMWKSFFHLPRSLWFCWKLSQN
jgi:N-acylglucosamine 2-epimerase